MFLKFVITFNLFGLITGFYAPPHLMLKSPTTHLHLFFDNKFQGAGSGKERLDEQWEAQQEILRRRRLPAAEREKYFSEVSK